MEFTPARHAVRARRAIAGLVLGGLVAAGLLVHGTLPDSAATDIAGDALYAAAVYVAIVVVAPRVPVFAVGAIAASWCVAVELFQLTGLPLAWGARFTPAMLVFGTVFDARDLVVYVAAISVATVLDALIRRIARKRAG